MSKKKIVAKPSSGVDLSNLTDAQLELLITEVAERKTEVYETSKVAARKVLEDSGELKTLKATWSQFVKEGKRLAKSVSFDIILPIRFTVNSDGPHLSEAFYYEDAGVDDLFPQTVTGKVIKDGTLNKKQFDLLNDAVEQYAADACNEILELSPADVSVRFDQFVKDVNTFVSTVTKQGLSIEDFQ